MPFFNGTIVTKKLRNRYIFQKTLENEQSFIHLDTLIVPQILRQFPRRDFSHYSKMLFPDQNNVPVEMY